LIPEDHRYSKTDVSFSLRHATAIAVGLTPILGVVVLGPYCLIWGMDSLLAATLYFRQLQILLPVVFISIVVHEGLHWMGYVAFAHLPWETVRLGFNPRSLAAYAHSDSPVSISAYRRLVALPGVILGVIPAFVGIAWEGGLITLYGFLMLIGACGDLAILWKIRRVSPDSLVMDPPTRAGCWVLAARRDEDVQSSSAERRTHLSRAADDNR
jgi:hypothetical protein